jgi:hypothetical protein
LKVESVLGSRFELYITKTGGTASNSYWKVLNNLSQTIKIWEWFLSIYSGLIAWWTLWCEGVTRMCSKKVFDMFGMIQNAKNNWMGSVNDDSGGNSYMIAADK